MLNLVSKIIGMSIFLASFQMGCARCVTAEYSPLEGGNNQRDYESFVEAVAIASEVDGLHVSSSYNSDGPSYIFACYRSVFRDRGKEIAAR